MRTDAAVAAGGLLSMLLPACLAASPLTLARALEVAFENRAQLAGDRARVDEAEAQAREVRALLRPRLEVQAVAVDGLSGAKGGGLGVQGIASSQLVADFAAGLNVYQVLYDSGALRHRRRSFGMLATGREASERSSRRTIGLEVVRGYLEVLEQVALLELTRELLEQRTRAATQSRASLRAGLGSEADASLADLYASRARSEVARVRGALERARATLSRSMGVPEERVGEPDPIAFAPPEPAPEADYLVLALRDRPELAALRAEVFAAEEAERAEHAASRTQVVGFLSGGTANVPANRGPEENLEWAGGIALRIPIDASRALRARVEQARSREQLARARLAEAEQAVALEVRSAARDLRALREQVTVAGDEVSQAQLALQVAASRLEAGLGTVLERLLIESALVEARTRQQGVRLDVLEAWVRLHVSAGMPVGLAVEQLGEP